MKKSKLLLVFLALLALTLVFAACGNETATTPVTTTNGTTAITTVAGSVTTTSANTSTPSTTTKTPSSVTTPTTTAGITPPPATTTKAPTTTVPVTTASGEYSNGLPEVMPVFNIDTNDVPITSKEEYITGTLSIDKTSADYALKDAELEIRGRGNYSWFDIEKKSYKIKLTEKENLLGQGNGPARQWTLLAVHCDQSMLRTAAAFDFARKLSGLDYTSSASFVKLYLNGEYQGVYQLSEQMQVQKYRVNVDDTGFEDETGFLVELDFYANYYDKNAENVVYDDYGNQYGVKSDYNTYEQLDFIEEYLCNSIAAVYSGNRSEVEEFIDLDSVVDAYIVEELFKNLDVGWSSFYMYREIGGKLHFGPLWDFDLSAGNADGNDNNPDFPSPKYLYVGTDYFGYSQEHPWFVELMKYDWFQELVKERWAELEDEIAEIPLYIRSTAELYRDEFNENFLRWPIFGQKINREPAAVRALKSHAEHAEYLAQWIEARTEWMTSYFKGETSGIPTGSESSGFECSGGEGTKASPYLISNADDFNSFTQALYSGTKFKGVYFKQTADIDMSNYLGYRGIGSAGEFAGYYNGNGYKINIKLVGTDESVFPYVTGTVINLFTTGSIENTAQASGIARSVRVGGAIINCASTVKLVSSGQNAGGITSSNQTGGGTVSGCFFAGTLSAFETSGAINCYIQGRGGEFTYNYYLNTAEGTSIGNETAFTKNEARTLHQTLNSNLSKLSGGVAASELCTWKLGANSLPEMNHK